MMPIFPMNKILLIICAREKNDIYSRGHVKLTFLIGYARDHKMGSLMLNRVS